METTEGKALEFFPAVFHSVLTRGKEKLSIGIMQILTFPYKVNDSDSSGRELHVKEGFMTRFPPSSVAVFHV